MLNGVASGRLKSSSRPAFIAETRAKYERPVPAPLLCPARWVACAVADWSLADRGFSLFPLHKNTKTPAGKWRQYMQRHATPAELTSWERTFQPGVATGAISGVIVLDCDNLLARIECERLGLPATFTVSTPRGTHFYFTHPGWHLGNKVGLMWDGWQDLGVDIRGDGGFVVGPGSHYVPTAADMGKGKVAGSYAIEQDLPVALMPEWLYNLLLPKSSAFAPVVEARVAETTSPFGRKAMNEQLADLSNAQDGQVSHQLYATTARIAELVAGGEIVQEEGWGGLHEILVARGLEDEDKANGTVQRAWAKGYANPKSAPEREGGAVTPEQALGTRGPIEAPAIDLNRPFRPTWKPGFVSGNEVLSYFDGVAYVVRRDEMFLPSGVMVGRSGFDGLYAGPKFVMDTEGDGKPERSAWRMFRENTQVDMPKVWDVCFRPELPPGKIVDIEGLPFLNIYVPINTPCVPGDASPFVNHVRKMLPHGQDADLLLHYMAACVQNPGAKFQWWPVVQGVKGNGKTLLLEAMIAAIGERYSHLVKADAVLKTGNQFNDWIVGKLFLGFEEIKSSEGKRDFVEIMKDTVTNRRLATEAKGSGQRTSDNRANGIMLTNHDDACPIDDDERRWGIFFCAQQTVDDLERDGMTGSYFPDLYDWLRNGGSAHVTHYLKTMPLQAELNPLRLLHRAPHTSSTKAAVGNSLGLLEQEIQEAIEGGQHGFKGGVVTSLALRTLFDRLRKTIAPKRYRGIMASLGYVQHPALVASNKGRPNNALYDGTRPVLYYKKGSPILSIKEPISIAERTEEILKGTDLGSNVVPLRR